MKAIRNALVRRCARLSAALPLLFTGVVVSAAPPPAEVFFKPLAFPQMVISPHGNAVATLASSNGSINIIVIDLATKKAAAVTGYAAPAQVEYVRWKSDDRLIYVVKDYSHQRNVAYNIGAVDRDGKNHLLMADNRNIQESGSWREHIVDLKIDDPAKILIASDREYPAHPVIYDTDTASLWHPLQSKAGNNPSLFDTRREKITSAPGRNCSYITDLHGDARVCLSLEVDLSEQLIYRETANAPWQTLATFTQETGFIEPLGFTPDNKSLYVLSNYGTNTRALYAFDPATRTLGKKLFEAPGVDIRGGIFAADGRQLLGVSYTPGATFVHYLDRNTGELQAGLQRAFPSDRVGIYSQTVDGKRAIIRVENDQSPGKFFLYDDTKQSVSPIVDRAPWVDPKAMGAVRTVSLKSRDGLELNGYLTLPPGRADKNLPLVVDVHGGPYGIRDYDGWNADTQFFATRGYAVLQVNYRGSGGYGSAFQQAGKHEFAGKMQDDITDGVEWAVKQGIVDRKRVAIFGASYGGYAAMMGLVGTPDLYRCGITYSGVSDLQEIFAGMIVSNSVGRERSREEMAFWLDQFGGDKNPEILRKKSPLYNIEAIKAPVFIAHGVDDLIASYASAEKFRNALQSAGKTVEFYGRPDEGHGFDKAENNVELFSRIEQFLQKCNPAD